MHDAGDPAVDAHEQVHVPAPVHALVAGIALGPSRYVVLMFALAGEHELDAILDVVLALVGLGAFNSVSNIGLSGLNKSLIWEMLISRIPSLIAQFMWYE